MLSLAALRRLKLRTGNPSQRRQPNSRAQRTCYEWLEYRQLLAVMPQLVSDINSNPALISDLGNLTNVNGTLFFTANDITHGTELWRSDGTAVGTVLVKDIRSGNDSSEPGMLTNVNGTLYFSANDGTNGTELWESDGTAVGTVLVKDIRNGSDSSYPSLLANVNGTLFFTANDGMNGVELWKSDGTDAGTVLVKDIQSGGSSSYPYALTNVNGTLFFTANDGTHGIELWKFVPLVSGDFNRDGERNSADVGAMLSALSDLHFYEAQQALDDTDLLTLGDLNGDQAVTNADLQALLNLLKSGNGSQTGAGGGSVEQSGDDNGNGASALLSPAQGELAQPSALAIATSKRVPLNSATNHVRLPKVEGLRSVTPTSRFNPALDATRFGEMGRSKPATTVTDACVVRLPADRVDQAMIAPAGPRDRHGYRPVVKPAIRELAIDSLLDEVMTGWNDV